VKEHINMQSPRFITVGMLNSLYEKIVESFLKSHKRPFYIARSKRKRKLILPVLFFVCNFVYRGCAGYL